jgi:hypothetical protein
MARFALGMIVVGLVAASSAASSEPVQQGAAPAEDPTDIVVNGELEMPERPRTAVLPAPVLPGRDIDKAAASVDAARRAAQCATRGRIVRLSLLREVVDGPFPSSTQERAQDWLVRQTATCGEGAAIALSGVTIQNSQSYVGTLRRAAFIAESLKAFAPDLRLTTQRMKDPVVQARFEAREVPLARYRRPMDLTYFRVAICMVREQPGLAMRLVRTDPVVQSTAAIQAHLIDRARSCVGDAKTVTVDRYEFRAYIADAVYRWALAVRGVQTLIPDTVEATGRPATLNPSL